MLELVMKAHESIMQGTDRVLSLEHVSSRTVLLQKVPNLHVQCSLLIRSIGIAHTIPEASKTGVNPDTNHLHTNMGPDIIFK